MIELASHNACTGCGACAYKCPKGCIKMEEDHLGIIFPVVDKAACIGCHACERICPILNELPCYPSRTAYAAWSNDVDERHTSASGGIAMEMYKHALAHGYAAVGASQNDDFSVTHKMTDKTECLAPFKNSKYVFSSSLRVFPQIRDVLAAGCKVIFVGLPCQVAALRKLFCDHEDLFLVDVVCHGVTPYVWLKQHIDMLSRNVGTVARRMSFRDPHTYTYTFTFTLYSADNQCFYAKRTKDGDSYQFGYHRAVSYRENCYQCRFAKPERVSDITIADYHGLGLCKPCSYDARNVSLILENTEKGSEFVKELIDSGRIFTEQRPTEEPFMGERQLRHPSVKTKYRIMFEKEIVAHNGNFEMAMKKPMAQYYKDNILLLPLKMVKKVMKSMFGNSFKSLL